MADAVVEATAEKRKAPERALRETTKRTRVGRQVIDPALLSSDEEDDDQDFDLEASSDLSEPPSDFEDGSVRSSKTKKSKAGTATPLTTNSTTNSATPTRTKFPSEYKTIKCTIPGCGKAFNRPARLASHMRSHNNERPFNCPYDDCDKAYLEEKHLKQHIKGTHTNERDHQCYVEGCGKSFLTATRLRRHQAAHEGHERFRCSGYPPCSQTFRKHQTLQRHIRSDHLELTPYPCLYVDETTGEACNAGYDSAGALRKHEDRVHGAIRFWCDECSKDGGQPTGFTGQAQLNKHMRTEHADCIFCDMKCSSEKELQRHIDTFHSGVKKAALAEKKTVPCTVEGCTKMFTKKYNVEVHVRNVHEGQRFICGKTDLTNSSKLESWDGLDACGKDFVSKVNLEDHVRTQHLGLPSTVNARRVKKNGIGAVPRGAPKAHIIDPVAALTGHGYAQNREIACLVQGCTLRFMREYDRLLHLRAKHGFTPAEVPPLQGYKPDPARLIPCLAKDCDWFFFHQDELELHKQGKHDGMQGGTVDHSLLTLSDDFKAELARGEHSEQYHVPDVPPQNLLFNQQTGVFEHYHGPTHAGRDYAECINLGCQHANCATGFEAAAAGGQAKKDGPEGTELNSNYFNFEEFGTA